MHQEKTKEKIFELTTRNIHDIVNSQIKIDNLLLSLLFESSRIDFGYKVNHFDNILSTPNEESCCVVFDKIGVEELKIFSSKEVVEENIV